MIYIVNDHGGIQLKNYLLEKCAEINIEITDLYNIEDANDDYPLVADLLADKMKEDKNSFGVAICGSGQGINMAMNRHSWVRAALPATVQQAMRTREHNDANCLSLGQGEVIPEVAFEMLKVFIQTKSPSEERHLRRISELSY